MNEPKFADLTTFQDGLPEDAEDDAQDEPEDLPQADPEEEPEDEQAAEPLYEVPLKDEFGQDTTVKVTLDELRNGYMRQAHFTRQTQDLSRQRDALADGVRQAIDQGRTQYIQQLETLRNAVIHTIEPEIRNVDWQKLAVESPEDYMRLQARTQQMNMLLTQIEAKQREQAETQAREDYSRFQERRRAAQETVIREIPGWSDELYSSTLSTLARKYGFDLEKELAPIIDPRIIKLMVDVTKYHQALDKRQITQKEIRSAPKPVKPGNTLPSRGSEERDMARLKRTHKLEDAARILDRRLSNRR